MLGLGLGSGLGLELWLVSVRARVKVRRFKDCVGVRVRLKDSVGVSFRDLGGRVSLTLYLTPLPCETLFRVVIKDKGLGIRIEL